MRLSIMVFGSYRTKKTFFAGSFPKPYFFDFDNGMATLIGKDVEYDTYNEEASATLRKCNAKIDSLIQKCPYDTVVVDSLTYLAEKALANTLLLNGRPNGVPTMHDWLGQMVTVKGFVNRFLLIPCKYIIVVCHEAYDKDELMGNIRIAPAITGKLAVQLPCLFDFILRSETQQDRTGAKIVLSAGSTSICSVGSRFLLKQPIFEPSHEAFMANLEVK